MWFHAAHVFVSEPDSQSFRKIPLAVPAIGAAAEGLTDAKFLVQGCKAEVFPAGAAAQGLAGGCAAAFTCVVLRER